MIRTNDLLEEHGANFKFPVTFGDGIVHTYKYKWGSDELASRLKSHVARRIPTESN